MTSIPDWRLHTRAGSSKDLGLYHQDHWSGSPQGEELGDSQLWVQAMLLAQASSEDSLKWKTLEVPVFQPWLSIPRGNLKVVHWGVLQISHLSQQTHFDIYLLDPAKTLQDGRFSGPISEHPSNRDGRNLARSPPPSTWAHDRLHKSIKYLFPTEHEEFRLISSEPLAVQSFSSATQGEIYLPAITYMNRIHSGILRKKSLLLWPQFLYLLYDFCVPAGSVIQWILYCG